MQKEESRAASAHVSRRGFSAFLRELVVNRTLYLMILPAFAFVIIFNYAPIYGLQLAFKKFNFQLGITGSPWVGLYNFLSYFRSIYFTQTTFNTLYLNFLFIVFGVSSQVVVAILLNEVTRRQQKTFQTAMFFPYFISWIVISFFVTALLSERFGMVNNVVTALGGQRISWFTMPKYWRVILTIASMWKALGYGSVIYLAKIMGIDAEIYESATIDGANKFQEIRCITLPMLKPTVILLLLIAIGGVFRGDFGMIWALTGENKSLLSVTEVIDTYVFRMMRLTGNHGVAAAVGLYQSLMGFGLVMLSNYLVRRYDPELALF